MLRVPCLAVILVGVAVIASHGAGFVAWADAGTPASPSACRSIGLRAPASPLATAVPSPPSAASPTTQAATAVTIETIDLAYDPCEVTIPSSTPVTITLRNTGSAVHGFVIDALGIDEQIAPGAVAIVTIDVPPGEYEFYSDVPGQRQAGMVGRLTSVGTETPAAGMPPSASAERSLASAGASLAAAWVTLAPGSDVTVPPGAGAGQTVVFVESGGPAAFALDGPATTILPSGGPRSFPPSGGLAMIGPLAGIVIPQTTGYALRNGGSEPLVLLWMASPAPEGPGVTVEPLVPAGASALVDPQPRRVA